MYLITLIFAGSAIHRIQLTASMRTRTRRLASATAIVWVISLLCLSKSSHPQLTNVVLRLSLETWREAVSSAGTAPPATLVIEVPPQVASLGAKRDAVAHGRLCDISRAATEPKQHARVSRVTSASSHVRAPDVVLVLLESVRYRDMPTSSQWQANAADRSQSHKRSRTIARLRREGLLVHAPMAFSTTPNSMKALYAVMCGVLPEPKLWDDYVNEYRLDSALLEGCLPRMLGRRRILAEAKEQKHKGVRLNQLPPDEAHHSHARRQTQYQSSFFSSSVSVDDLHGHLGFDEYVGYAGYGGNGSVQEGLDMTVRNGNARLGNRQNTGHGTFEQVNWLGLDDHVLFTPTTRALQRARASNRSAFVTLATVGTHSFFGLPSHVRCNDWGEIIPTATNDTQKPYQTRAGTPSASHVRYICSIANTDAWLGELVRRLKVLDDEQLTNTLLIVASDHGEAFEEHGLSDHGMSLHNEETHVPLWLAGGPIRRARTAGWLPEGDEASALPGIHRLEDIRPTILDLIGWGCRSSAEGAYATEEARLSRLYSALSSIGLAGQSMLALSTSDRRSGSALLQRAPTSASSFRANAFTRSLLLVGLFGERKVGLVEALPDGRKQKVIISWEGCGASCKVLRATRYDLISDELEAMPYGFGTNVSFGRSSKLEDLSNQLPHVLNRTFGLMNALISLHLHMRRDNKPHAHVGGASHDRKSPRQLSDGLVHVNRMLHMWLSSSGVTPSSSSSSSSSRRRRRSSSSSSRSRSSGSSSSIAGVPRVLRVTFDASSALERARACTCDLSRSK